MEILEAVVEQDSAARRAIPTRPLRALVFDSKFDQYLGVVCYVRVVDGAYQDRPENPVHRDRQGV